MNFDIYHSSELRNKCNQFFLYYNNYPTVNSSSNNITMHTTAIPSPELKQKIITTYISHHQLNHGSAESARADRSARQSDSLPDHAVGLENLGPFWTSPRVHQCQPHHLHGMAAVEMLLSRFCCG